MFLQITIEELDPYTTISCWIVHEDASAIRLVMTHNGAIGRRQSTGHGSNGKALRPNLEARARLHVDSFNWMTSMTKSDSTTRQDNRAAMAEKRRFSRFGYISVVSTLFSRIDMFRQSICVTLSRIIALGLHNSETDSTMISKIAISPPAHVCHTHVT